MALKYLCISFTQEWVEKSTIAECLAIDPTGFVSLSAASMAEQPSMQDIFAIPLAEDMAQMWSLGFGLPMTCYLVAWGFGVILNMLRDTKPY